MIPRLKRQTKKRHSARPQLFTMFWLHSNDEPDEISLTSMSAAIDRVVDLMRAANPRATIHVGTPFVRGEKDMLSVIRDTVITPVRIIIGER